MTTTDPQLDPALYPALTGGESFDLLSDVVILNQIAGGDLKYFDTFVDRYRDQLIQFFYKRVFDYHIAEDLSQEVFMRAFRAAQRKPLEAETGCLSPWLFTIAHNCMIDLFRRGVDKIKSQGHGDQISVQVSAISSGLDSSSHDPAEIVDRGEQQQVANDLLDELPDSQQQVVRLKIYDNKTFDEIAKKLDCPVPTAKSRMRYGLARIYQLMTLNKEKET